VAFYFLSLTRPSRRPLRDGQCVTVGRVVNEQPVDFRTLRVRSEQDGREYPFRFGRRSKCVKVGRVLGITESIIWPNLNTANTPCARRAPRNLDRDHHWHEPMPHAHEDDISIKGDAVLIAAQAKSLHATVLRDRPPGLPVSAGDPADAIELIELLADSPADLATLAEGHQREPQ